MYTDIICCNSAASRLLIPAVFLDLLTTAHSTA